MNKILFTIPPQIEFNDFANPSYNVRQIQKKNKNFRSITTDIPLGILSLSSYLKKKYELETRLLDFNVVLNKKESFEFKNFSDFFSDYFLTLKNNNYNPDIIGISSLFISSFKNTIDIGKCCKKIFPNAIILGGGGIATNMYREIYNNSECFNALCYGEGEKPLLNLIKSKNKIDYLERDASWITKKKVEKKERFEHNFIENLDDIPFLDYNLCNINDYNLNPALLAYASLKDKKNNFQIMTSRGCPHNCCFCSSHTVHGKKMRYYSIDRVKEDITRLSNEYNVGLIGIQDDNFLINKKRAFKIIDILKDLNVNFIFQNGLPLYALDEKTLGIIRKAGVDQLMIIAESGSNRVLKDIMHKKCNTTLIKRVIDDCRNLGIYTNVNIMLGLPGETKEDIEDTRQFLEKLNANWFATFVATPLVGSEMYDICVKKNYLKGDITSSDFKKAIVETEDFKPEYIQEKVYLLNLEFNFVKNSDFRLGNYKTALKGFENAISSKNDHALAYYYASLCYEKLGDHKTATDYLDNAKNISSKNPFWKKYINMFNIPI